MRRAVFLIMVLVVVTFFAGSVFPAIYYTEMFGVGDDSNLGSSYGSQRYSVQPNGLIRISVPEQTSILLFGTGLLSLVGIGRRRKLNLDGIKKVVKIISLVLLWRRH